MHNHLVRAALPCLVLAAAAILSGCAAPTRLYVDTADEPLRCTRFGWIQAGGGPTSIVEQRIRSEVMQALTAKGYAEDEESPDCLVTGKIFTGSRPASPASVGVGAGSWGGSFGGSVGVSLPIGGGARSVGNLAIDVIDVELNAEVWRGTLEGAFSEPDPTSDQVGAAVRLVLEQFPPRS